VQQRFRPSRIDGARLWRRSVGDDAPASPALYDIIFGLQNDVEVKNISVKVRGKVRNKVEVYNLVGISVYLSSSLPVSQQLGEKN